ncbi:glycosyltransferase family 39 protein [Niveibacterium sp. 24ML]|uniref:ArnT family glycosyltransferase n=1 Tax=Niveibacterium sp. 24ML TaxID=2985512 RepID=UPI002270672E|nr:glycosyltransferase family 39 protein [Niveibacterium sp. 24ML]MCX9156577.1 glycosyltransferase family 39 protein [Niveibacterium sp. 24ML]
MTERRIFSHDADEEPAAKALMLLLGAIVLLTAWRIWVVTHSGITLYVDEAYYWGWAKALDWGYFSKPPLIAGLIAASTHLLGDGLVGIKAGSLILYPATALLLFGLGHQLYGTRTALIGALAFLTLPITSALGLFISTDALLLFFWTAALWALHTAISQGRTRDWVLLGVVCGLGLMSKYTMAAFALSAAVLLIATQEGRRHLLSRGPWLTALVALAILAPNLWWNWANDFPTFRHTAEITQQHKDANLLEFIGAQFGSIGPLLAIGFIGAVVTLRSAWQHPGDRLLLAGSLPLLLLVMTQASTSEANANWAGPIFAGGTLLAVAWLSRTPRRIAWLKAALALNLLIMVVVYQWPQILHLADRPLTAKIDPFKRMKGWDKLALAIEPMRAAHPDAYIVADERTLLAHVAYTLREHSPRIASWNPARTVNDQYQLTHSLPNTPGLAILYLSKGEPNEVAPRFEQVEKLATIRVQTHPDFSLTTSVWLMQGFKGY